MSGYNEFSDLFDDDGHGGQGGGGLRRQLEEVLRVNRELSDKVERLERKGTVETLLKEKGKDPAAAALIPVGEDPAKWIDANARFLADAVKAEVEEPKVKVEEERQAAPEVPDPALEEERMAMETMAGLLNPDTGTPSTASMDPIAKLKSFQSEDELLAYIKSGGATS